MRTMLAGVVALGSLTATATSLADPPPALADLAGREAPVADLVPRPLLPLVGRGAGKATVSLSLSMAQRPERHDFAGSLVVSVPTSRFFSSTAVSSTKAKEVPADERPSVDEEAPDSQLDESSTETTRVPRANQPILPLIRPRDARAAITAALRVGGTAVAGERLDDLASRARWSALLPQVRLRATRLIDESASLSPTSYDANRTTASGGSSLWLEARTTWSLDRLVFAQEEVPIERLRDKLRDDHAQTRRRVLDLLFRWQRASYRVIDPLAHPDQCPVAWLEEQQRAAELDVATDGWLTRWRAEQVLEPVLCPDWEGTEGR
ncbi:MAG: hypothetical protein JRI68_02710 [Deltaproteobacteria bacterium]|nr:hypothetical protein [Deltaproteobacteria bacterium]